MALAVEINFALATFSALLALQAAMYRLGSHAIILAGVAGLNIFMALHQL